MSDWARPALTVDIVLIASTPDPSILLVQRANEPFAGSWALPGGFVDDRERVRDAAARELAEETGIEAPELALLDVYDTPGRDPRGWTVSVTFVGRLDEKVTAAGGDDASDAAWFALNDLPKLAFDHALIVADAARAAS